MERRNGAGVVALLLTNHDILLSARQRVINQWKKSFRIKHKQPHLINLNRSESGNTSFFLYQEHGLEQQGKVLIIFDAAHRFRRKKPSGPMYYERQKDS